MDNPIIWFLIIAIGFPLMVAVLVKITGIGEH